MIFWERWTNGLSSWLPFSSTIFQRWLPSPPMLISVAFFSHDAGEAVGIVAEAGGITHQESLRIFEQRLERIGIFASVLPGINAAVRHDGLREVIVQQVVNHVDAVAHPLVGDAAGEIFVEAEFEIGRGSNGRYGLLSSHLLPIRILLRGSVHFRPAAPARTMIVPDDLDFADLAQRAAARSIPSRRSDKARCDAACRSGRSGSRDRTASRAAFASSSTFAMGFSQ